MNNLNVKFIDNISKNGRFYDGNGLILFVSGTESARAKSWVFRYTSPITSKRRDMGLGPCDEIGLARARQLAAKATVDLAEGIDPLNSRPSSSRPASRSRNRVSCNLSHRSFEAIVREFHDRHKVTLKNEKYAEQWLRNMARLLFSELGARRVDSIDANDLLKVMQPMALKTPETARRLILQLGLVFEDALARGLVPINIVNNLKVLVKYPLNEKQNHASLNWREAPKFVAQLLKSDLTETVKNAYLFLILTGGRTSEILNANWGEIDNEFKLWSIPAARMKAARPHRVYLSKQAGQILQEVCAVASNQNLATDERIIFVGRDGRSPINSNSLLNATKKLGYQGVISVHGFRGTFSTWAHENEIASPQVIEASLAHSSGTAISRAYNHSEYFMQRSGLLQTWADFIMPLA